MIFSVSRGAFAKTCVARQTCARAIEPSAQFSRSCQAARY